MDAEAVDPGSWAALLNTPVAVAAAAVLGALWGSFFNVCIARIPRGLSVVRPPSHCFACGAAVRAWDNIPVLSFFLLRGRCRACGAQFSLRYPAIEALMGGLSAILYWQFVLGAEHAGDSPGLRLARFALAFAFTGVLLVLSFIDLDTKRLPDVITLPAIPLFFLAGFGTNDVPWLDRLIGAAAGYLAVRIIADGYYYLTGREGLGLGDGKLLAVIGAVLGWRSLPVVVFLASMVGVLVSIPILYWQQRKQKGEPPEAAAPAAESPPDPVPAAAEPALDPSGAAPGQGEGDLPVASIRRTEVPFGPFLALSALVYLLAGQRIWNWFVGRLGGE